MTFKEMVATLDGVITYDKIEDTIHNVGETWKFVNVKFLRDVGPIKSGEIRSSVLFTPQSSRMTMPGFEMIVDNQMYAIDSRCFLDVWTLAYEKWKAENIQGHQAPNWLEKTGKQKLEILANSLARKTMGQILLKRMV